MTSKRLVTRSGTSRRVRTVVLGGIVGLAVVILAIVGVVAMAASVGRPGQPVIIDTVTGTVAVVNINGTAICLKVASAQDNLCYGVWRLRGESVPAVSDTVTGWVVRVPTSFGAVEQLILKPNGSVVPGPGIGTLVP